MNTSSRVSGQRPHPERIALILLAFAASTASGQVLVRSCVIQPAASGFDACPNSTWETPAGAGWIVSNRATLPWLRLAELAATDRVIACTAPSITAGSAWGACQENGVAVPVPGRTDNWMLVSQLTAPPPPTPGRKVIRFKWTAPTLDLEKLPLNEESRLTGYVLSVREDWCVVPGSNLCGTAEWADIPLPLVSSYEIATETRKCAVLQSVGASGPGGVTDEVCRTPVSLSAPAPASDFRAE